MWKRETPAKVTEALVDAHEKKVTARRLRDAIAGYDGTPWQLERMTGQEPLDEDE